ncbi:hypothetical protein [Rariglobus hedericola]|uniref:Uncharacterized protein n=1 Tax=Rariglobus hedericola TaxID=2597822 RepID=A0A556QAX3_9BACT|nr:hypothetical protein [Rariglobus hedericola]TSJ73793.1 hypothetical protein FPL22_17575 [Rariglobus hedericola]
MKSPFKFVLAVIGCGLLASIAVSTLLFWSSTETTLHTAKINWLPASAKDVSHEVTTGMGGVEMIECTLPEVDFIALAKMKDWKIEREKDFSANLRIQSLPRLRNIEFLGEADVVLRGYKYSLRKSNGGGITVCYDSDLQRMIYQTSHR